MYSNPITRKNPGLLVLIIDQSIAMSEKYDIKTSLAEHASEILNKIISKTILSSSDFKGDVYDCFKIIIIGHGGFLEENKNTYYIVIGSNKELAYNPLRIERSHNPRLVEGWDKTFSEMELEMEQIMPKPIWIEPKAVGAPHLDSAFEKAYIVIEGWNETTSKNFPNPLDNPVPWVVNLSGVVQEEQYDRICQYTDKIKNIRCPNGNPMILNIYVTDKEKPRLLFPWQKPLTDTTSELLFETSSYIPEPSNLDSPRSFGDIGRSIEDFGGNTMFGIAKFMIQNPEGVNGSTPFSRLILI